MNSGMSPHGFRAPYDSSRRGFLIAMVGAGVMLGYARVGWAAGGLLEKAPLSPTGLTKINRYLLHEPFGQLTIDDIFNDDVIEAIVSPAPPKNRPSKTTAGATRNRAGS